jgi:hypothetical protein
LHVHVITNKRIDVNQCRQLSKRSGWGRIHVMRIPKERAAYLAKYLSKERPPAFKRWRLWAGFGKCWDWTKVAQIEVNSLYARVARGLRDAFHWKGNRDYHRRRRMIDWVVENTILNGWTPGRGPEGKAYQDCSRLELIRSSRNRRPTPPASPWSVPRKSWTGNKNGESTGRVTSARREWAPPRLVGAGRGPSGIGRGFPVVQSTLSPRS